MVRRSVWVLVLVIGTLTASCAGQPTRSPTVAVKTDTPTSVLQTQAPPATETSTSTATPRAEAAAAQATPATSAGAIASSCQLTPIVAPTMAPNPGYTELDRSTGLHVTGSPKTIDLATYRLKVTGLVDQPLSLSYDDLRCMPKVTANLILSCPGVFEDEATWSGVPLSYVLGLAGMQSEATWIAMVAADNYTTHMELKDALKDGNFLAYEWDGQPLPVLHGFPVRAVFSSMPGGRWVKWLLEIRVEQSSGSLGIPVPSR